MEKTATLNLRINPDIKKSAEDVLSALGLTMTAAINIYVNVLPPIEAGASCFNENSVTNS